MRYTPLNIISLSVRVSVKMQDPRRKTGVPVPDKPEHKPQRPREEPTKPSPDIPEQTPQRPREDPVIPSPDIPEREPYKTPNPKRISRVLLSKRTNPINPMHACMGFISLKQQAGFFSARNLANHFCFYCFNPAYFQSCQ